MFRLEVIDYVDQSNQSLIARVPEMGTAAIPVGAQLIVQQNQEAIFFRDGRAMDSFGPGRFTLSTSNLPILGKILAAPFDRTPFQASVYFIGKHTFIDQRWGTRTPVSLRDPEYGNVRLKGYGKFAYRVTDGSLLLNTLVGTQGKLTTEEILNYLRDVILAGLTDLLATAKILLVDLPSRMDDLSAATRIKLGDQFSKYGLELTEFFISSLSVPEDLQNAIESRSAQPRGNNSQRDSLQSFATKSAESVPSSGDAVTNRQPSQVPSGLDLREARVPTKDDLQVALTAIARSMGWTLQKLDADRVVAYVPLSNSRRQRVYVDLHKTDESGAPYVGLWSPCGAINPASASAILRSNDSLVHSAFALKRIEQGELLVLKSNLMTGLINSSEFAKVIAALAWQADEIEQQLSGELDNF
jgi:membrane protease subunit (stomatin/prohibitin family)